MLKRITTCFMALCLFILMTAPMAVRAEEAPATEAAETVSGNDLTEPETSETGSTAVEEEKPAPTKGWLCVTKTDAKTGALLPSASFTVYHAADDTEAGKLLTGKGGTDRVALAPGDYYLLEQCAPEGYELSGERYPVVIAGGEIKDLTITNKRLPQPEPTTGTLTITKTDADQKDKLLSGAVFSVYEAESGKKTGELMTGKEGTASLELPAGNYTVKETAAPEGYTLSTNPVRISLQAGSVKELTVTNRREEETDEEPGTLRITKRDAESGERLKDAVFGIYDKDTDNRMGEVTTDRKGVAEIELEPGDYYLLELEAPAGYQLDEEKIGFRIHSGKTKEKTIENVKKDTDETEDAVKETPAKENQTKEPASSQTSPFASIFSGLSTAQISQTSGESQKEDKNTGTLQIINVAAGTGEKLSGQILTVYSSDGKKAGEVTVKGGTGTLTLTEGDYYLRERKSPAGFFGETARIRFSITEGMTTIVEITSERDMEHTNPQDIIPKTGEPLPLLPLGLSALCLLAAAVCDFSLKNMKHRHQ